MRACMHEEAVLAATRAMAIDPMPDALIAHLADCDACRELHIVVSALEEDRAAAMAHARVPTAGQSWWRAELRAHHEAAAIAMRPITIAGGLASACLVGLVASLAGVIAWWVQGAMDVPDVVVAVAAMIVAGEWPAPTGLRLAMWLAAGAMLVATPVVLLFALREE